MVEHMMAREQRTEEQSAMLTWKQTYRKPRTSEILPARKKATLTAGLMCPPANTNVKSRMADVAEAYIHSGTQ